MSDRYPAEISIGGKIPKKLISSLLDALEGDGVMDSGFESSLDREEIANVIQLADKGKTTADFADDQASYGTFSETEAFCEKHRLGFVRHSDAYSEFNAERVVFLPETGMKEPKICDSDQNKGTLISLEKLRSYKPTTPLSKVIADLSVYERSLLPVEVV